MTLLDRRVQVLDPVGTDSLRHLHVETHRFAPRNADNTSTKWRALPLSAALFSRQRLNES
jgi:hypothetical protein